MAETRLIVGLGNPEQKYQYTRHNFGFLVVEELARKNEVKFRKDASAKALAGSYDHEGVNVMLQIAGDLLVETLLVYFTGGLDSPFSFLYLVSIITASMLLYRRGGLLAASGAVILYGVLLPRVGFVISMAVLVILSAMASREFTWKAALLSTIVLGAFSYLVFVKGLELQFPVWPPFLTR